MIDYDETWALWLLFKCKGSLALSSFFWAVPAAGLASLFVWITEVDEKLLERMNHSHLSQSHIWNMLSVTLMFLIGFRTQRAIARFWEGCGLLHQMKGEWFDTCSNCVSFTISAMESKPKEVMLFRHTLVRLMSLCHASALEEISGITGAHLETIDVYGLDTKTLRYLKKCVELHNFNKVEVLVHLLQSLITRSHEEGILKVPPPILSRCYQTISRGYVHLLNTKKITHVKFPFPYAQVIAVLMFLHLFFLPFMVAAAVQSKILAPIITFVVMFGVSTLNNIAQELENPFGLDDNDLPIDDFQAEMNNCLLMLLNPNTDLIPGVSKKCKTDFDLLESGTQSTKSISTTPKRNSKKMAAAHPHRFHSQVFDRLGLTNRSSDLPIDQQITEKSGEKETKWQATGSLASCSSDGEPGTDSMPPGSPHGSSMASIAIVGDGRKISRLTSDASKQIISNSVLPLGQEHPSPPCTDRIEPPAALSIAAQESAGLVLASDQNAAYAIKDDAELIDVEITTLPPVSLSPILMREIPKRLEQVRGASSEPGMSPDLVRRMESSIDSALMEQVDDLNAALQRWTRTVENQVNNLSSVLMQTAGTVDGMADRFMEQATSASAGLSSPKPAGTTSERCMAQTSGTSREYTSASTVTGSSQL